MVGEVRQALLLQRVGLRPDAMTAREALEIATLGGAKVLGPRRHRRARAGHGGGLRRRSTCRQPALRGRAARSGGGAGVLRAAAGVSTSVIDGEGGRAGRADVDDARTRRARQAAQPAGGGAGEAGPDAR